MIAFSHQDVRPKQDAKHGHAVRVLVAVIERQPRNAAVVQPAVGPIGEIAAVALVPSAHTEGRVLHQHAERLARHRLLLAGKVPTRSFLRAQGETRCL